MNLSFLRALILDMDGVLWHGDEPIGNLPAIFGGLKQHKIQVALVTNNSTRSAQQYIEKLSRFNVILETWQIINSSQTTAQYLRTLFPNGGAVYVVGEEGLSRDLLSNGFYTGDRNVVAVVAGLDRNLTYDKLTRASLLIRSGALFVGTNPDKSFPTPEGETPGAGAILAALEAATGVQPIIIGKPNPEMYLEAMNRLGSNKDNTLVVGDRLETDIAGAQAIGCRTALVLTGVSTLQSAQLWHPPPDFIFENLNILVENI